ncbi:MAG: DegT/DnrJ/EryC1/StrS family aminotransferase [Bacteroidia bacterium]|nr:DegT/DnrJ/EryC1/StrS family aminotransferase [Bacteroidia bacterium]
MIPFFDLKLQYRQIEGEIRAAMDEVFQQTAFVDGPFVARFEEEFAEYIGTSQAVAVNSGTSALILAMHALGVGPGDEVIVPANTFIATAFAVSLVGGKPVFVDCRRDTWNIDAQAIAARITDKTVGVIGVHLYGAPFDVAAVQQICEAHNLWLVEDCAQSHGAEYKEEKVGRFGVLSCFSFYPGKNLGAYGQGGAVLTDNVGLAERMKRLRNYGSPQRYYFDEVGHNLRMDGLQAAILSVKLRHLDAWNERKIEIANRYRAAITKGKGKWQCHPGFSHSVYHLFVIMHPNRDGLMTHLNDQGIFPGIHYPVPCHLQKAYEHLGYKAGDCPNAELLSSQCLSLPMYPELTDAQVERVIEAVNGFEG